MKISFNAPKPVAIKAGEHTATKTGFIFERRVVEGSPVSISQNFLDEHKAKTGREFTSSWLKPAEETKAPISESAKAEETKAKPKQ